MAKKDFWEDVWKSAAKQRRIQAQEQREKAKQSSSGGKGRGGKSRGYFSRSGGRGKSQGVGRTSRISSKGYTHQTNAIVKKINPNGTKYNNSRVIKNALNYIAGISEIAEQKNEDVKLMFFNGNDRPMEIQDNQKAVDTFFQNLRNDIDILTEENKKTPL